MWAWVQMSMCIRGNRILTDMSMNEMVIYSILFRKQREGGELLTATELGEETRLLKSQINKILSYMERKNLIERIRSREDKRRVYIHLRADRIQTYLNEHRRVMELVRYVAGELGEEKMRTLTALVDEATGAVDRFQRDEAGGQDGPYEPGRPNPSRSVNEEDNL